MLALTQTEGVRLLCLQREVDREVCEQVVVHRRQRYGGGGAPLRQQCSHFEALRAAGTTDQHLQ